MSAIREHGLRIPEDIAVIGFGGFEWGQYVTPPLTTISLDVVTMAARIRTLFEPADGDKPIELLTLIPPMLVTRRSC